MNSTHSCPRRAEVGGTASGQDTWRANNTCSYCGSLNPDEFMAHVEAGTIVLTPTDKNYKVYVEGAGINTKFYFQHLSTDQKKRFVDCMNETGKLKLDLPGYFYVLPFFCRSFPDTPK